MSTCWPELVSPIVVSELMAAEGRSGAGGGGVDGGVERPAVAAAWTGCAPSVAFISAFGVRFMQSLESSKREANRRAFRIEVFVRPSKMGLRPRRRKL